MRRSAAGGCLVLLATACAGAGPARAQSAGRLFVLRPPDALVEYDVATFVARRTIAVPAYLAGAPEFVQVNAAGQVIFMPPKELQWAGPDMAPASGRMWLWDGRAARADRLSTRVTVPGARSPVALEVAPEWWLSARGDSLYVFENRFQTTVGDRGIEQSVRSGAALWRMSLDGAGGGRPGGRDTIAALPAGADCRCGTGVCSETCPEWSFWAPPGGVADVFLLTRWIPGQLGPTYEETRVFRRGPGGWVWSRLPQALEAPLASSASANLLVSAERDAGCCGWANDSSDRLLLLRDGVTRVLYDEFTRYANADYDVSISPADARLAPGDRRLAYTLVARLLPDSGEIRLSSDGKDNPAELARIHRVLPDLPQVEVVELAGAGRRLATIPRAALVGWLDEDRLLIARGGHLVVCDLRRKAVRDTGIPVRSAADAFLF